MGFPTISSARGPEIVEITSVWAIESPKKLQNDSFYSCFGRIEKTGRKKNTYITSVSGPKIATLQKPLRFMWFFDQKIHLKKNQKIERQNHRKT